MSSDTFQVDLRGIVDLLSHHIYSSPRVYLRELIQNAVDALTALGENGSSYEGRPGALIVPSDAATDGRLHVMDSGIGLDADDVRTFLATIGRSSKRDEVGLARSDLLGQFGIGLLSAFMVTDEIEVLSRRHTPSADPSDPGAVVRWRGRADGSYTLDAVRLDALAGDQVPDERPDERRAWLTSGPGTCVSLRPRRGAEQWLTADTVLDLARHFAALLPHRLVVRTPAPVEVAPTVPPWRLSDPEVRRTASRDYAVTHLGGEPFQVLPVRVPRAELDGVVVIAGAASSTARRATHRVYVKGMLVSDRFGDLLPEWAFFARAAVDGALLTPTASREDLYRDDVLDEVRSALGDQIRAWLLRLARTDARRMGEFLQLHHLAVKAMALQDDELLAIVLPLLPFETNQGTSTVPQLIAGTDVIRVTETVEEFRQVAVVAAAQGVTVANGGYAYEYDLLRRIPEVYPDLQVEPIAAGDLDAHIRTVPDARLLGVRSALERARAVLDRLQVDVELRSFAPVSLPALYLDDAQARRRRASRQTATEVDDVWSAILTVLDDGGSDRPRLLLNDENPVVRRVLAIDSDPADRADRSDLAALAVESLYCRALLSGQHPMRPVDTAAMDRSFLGLLDHALNAEPGADPGAQRGADEGIPGHDADRT